MGLEIVPELNLAVAIMINIDPSYKLNWSEFYKHTPFRREDVEP